MYRLFEILCVSAAFVANIHARDGPRSVHLALETSLLFEPKDAYKHLKFIAEARKFLDKLENAIAPPKILRSGDQEYLTKFLGELAETLIKFGDEQLHQFFISLELEMRVHFYKGSIFREILYDPKLLMYLRKKLKEWASSDPRMTRARLSKYMLTDRIRNTPLNRLGSFLNDYYEHEQNGKMSEIVEKLRNIDDDDDKDDNDEVGRIIRDGINTLVIQHYDRMNYTTRAKLADEINKLNDFSKIAKSDVDEDLKLSFRRFIKDISDTSALENSNEVDKKKSKETLVYQKNAELFLNAIEATMVDNSDKVKDEIKKKDNITVDNLKLKDNKN